MLPETAAQIVRDEMMLDGNSRQNLATFVGTWMDEYADRLYAATFDKNMIDKDEYPQTAEIESRCVRMLADLWHAPDASMKALFETILARVPRKQAEPAAVSMDERDETTKDTKDTKKGRIC